MNRYLQALKRQKHPIKFIIMKLLFKSKLSNLFKIRRENYILRFYPSSLSCELWVDSKARQSAERFFQDYLYSGDKVIDVGANIGTLTLEAAIKVGNSGKVFSIEAHPRVFKYLQGNIKLNQLKNIQTFNIAIGNENRKVVFSDIRADDRNFISHDNIGIKINMARLDDLLINESEIALMKIDTEGYEKFVLEGGERTLKKTKCVYFESWDTHFEKYDYTSADVCKILWNNSFEIYKIIGEKTISQMTREHRSNKRENLLAIRNLDNFQKRTGIKIMET